MIAQFVRGPLHGRTREIEGMLDSYTYVESRRRDEVMIVHTYVRAPQLGFFVHDPSQTITRPMTENEKD